MNHDLKYGKGLGTMHAPCRYMASYRKRTMTEFMPTFRVAPDTKNLVKSLLSEDEDLGEFCRVAVEAEIVRRTTSHKNATQDTTKMPR